LILALLAWLSFFVEGISTGLGIYRHPDSCWIAAGVAVLAALCAHASQRWWAVLALALAVGGALYGYQHNARTREWWQRFEARQHAAESSQSSTNKQVSVPTIDTFGCARFHPFGNGKPQERAGAATRERRKPWRRQAPPFPDESVIHRELAFPAQIPRQSRQRVLETWSMSIHCAVPHTESDGS
jgi:hypothetical protein